MKAIQPMLAKTLRKQNVNGWLMSEKLDGVRAVWDGVFLWTRNGNKIDAPSDWSSHLPKEIPAPIDGELHAGRGGYKTTLSIYRCPHADWSKLTFTAFDLVMPNATAWERIRKLHTVQVNQVSHGVARNASHALELMEQFCTMGGEGVMLRNPDSEYIHGRTKHLLKLKPGEGA